jgi:5'(3')-deoxyribonucleotidase
MTRTFRGHVAIDLDDVVLDFTGGLRTSVQTEYDVEVPPFGNWKIADVLDPIIGHSWWKWMKNRDWLWKTFPAVPGAIGSINMLREQDYFIEIITSKPDWAEASVWQWMGRWRPSVDRVTIVQDGDSKAEFTSADILVDDKPQNCEEWVASRRPAVLFSRPHNETYRPSVPRIYRANSWADVRALVETHVNA